MATVVIVPPEGSRGIERDQYRAGGVRARRSRQSMRGRGTRRPVVPQATE